MNRNYIFNLIMFITGIAFGFIGSMFFYFSWIAVPVFGFILTGALHNTKHSRKNPLWPLLFLISGGVSLGGLLIWWAFLSEKPIWFIALHVFTPAILFLLGSAAAEIYRWRKNRKAESFITS